MTARHALLFCAMLLAALPLHARTLAFVGATVHTLGPEGSLGDATVLITDGVIEAVGRDLPLPDGAEVIDARGKVITPGLFAATSQLGLVEILLVEETVDDRQNDPRIGAAFDIADVVNPDSSLIPVNRIDGVTRALTMPRSGDGVFAGQAALMHLGGGLEPVTHRRVAMVATYGESGARLAGGSRASALARLAEALEDADDYRAHRGDYLRARRYPYAISRLDLEALQPVLRGEMPLLVHAHRASDILAVLRLARRFELQLVIAGAEEGWQVADRLAEARVAVIVDPLANLPRRFESLHARSDNAGILWRKGVTVAFSVYRTHNLRNLRQAAGNAVAAGLPWEAALEAITLNPARIWGVEESLGSLEPGKAADLVVWDGDPLEMTTTAEQVYVAGRAVPMESRQTLLRDRYWDLDRPLPPAWYRR